MQDLLILLNEDLKNKEKESYEKIYKFLNVQIKHNNYQIKLEGSYSKMKKKKILIKNLERKWKIFLNPILKN